MPFSPNQRTGQTGEDLAHTFLEKRGYRILARHFTCREGEIDLVAERRKVLVFIEVKYRRSDRFGSALESITREKLRRVRAAAAVYRQRTRDRRPYRFEVVAIDATEQAARIEHLTEL